MMVGRKRLWIGNAADSRGRCFRMPETQGSKVRLRLVGHGASFYKVIREKRSAALHILDCQQHRQDNNAMDEVRANEACTSRPKGPFQSSPTQRMHAVGTPFA